MFNKISIKVSVRQSTDSFVNKVLHIAKAWNFQQDYIKSNMLNVVMALPVLVLFRALFAKKFRQKTYLLRSNLKLDFSEVKNIFKMLSCNGQFIKTTIDELIITPPKQIQENIN